MFIVVLRSFFLIIILSWLYCTKLELLRTTKIANDDRQKRSDLCGSTRQTLSQFWCLQVSRTTVLNYIKLANILILRLYNCEKVGWAI